MFRWLAVGGGLALILVIAAPFLTQAAKRVMKKQRELYATLDAEDAEDAESEVEVEIEK